VRASAAAPAPAREKRVQDLLLASALARGQAVAAFDELAGRADRLAYRVVQVRIWLSGPVAWVAGSAIGFAVLTVALRRGHVGRLFHWGWRAWRLWRKAAPLLAPYRASLCARRPSGSA
jgi:hypothetical protein